MSDKPEHPDCHDCWLTKSLLATNEQLSRAWAQLDERKLEPVRRWWAVFGLCVAFFVTGMLVAAWALSPNTPRLDRAAAYATVPLPIVSQSMEVADHESVVLVRDGKVLRMHVLFDGVVRGQLLRLDTGTRVLELPGRPPANWKIGGL
jgi:hypothetical protein